MIHELFCISIKPLSGLMEKYIQDERTRKRQKRKNMASLDFCTLFYFLLTSSLFYFVRVVYLYIKVSIA